MKRILVVGTVIVIALLAGITWATNTEKEEAAAAVAQKWLALVDMGKYSESWREAAEYFRRAITQDQWEQLLQSVRMPLGKVISRELKTKVYQTTLPSAPDGQYVVIQFETSFENKKSAIETIIPMFENDGQWRVSGYYIK
jgi:hypothetical protein